MNILVLGDLIGENSVKRVKEIFPHMEDIEYKVGILDEFNS